MELKAELVLHDCNYAVSMHGKDLQGERFRLSWWTIVSLLRAVGHVLKKVDSKRSEFHAKIINDAYMSLQASQPFPEIYWGFIEPERNSFLKEYDYLARRQLTTKWTEEGGKEGSLSIHLDSIANATVISGLPGTFYESFIKDGPFKGQDEKQVAMMACAWWQNYLYEIRRAVDNQLKEK